MNLDGCFHSGGQVHPSKDASTGIHPSPAPPSEIEVRQLCLGPEKQHPAQMDVVQNQRSPVLGLHNLHANNDPFNPCALDLLVDVWLFDPYPSPKLASREAHFPVSFWGSTCRAASTVWWLWRPRAICANCGTIRCANVTWQAVTAGTGNR